MQIHSITFAGHHGDSALFHEACKRHVTCQNTMPQSTKCKQHEGRLDLVREAWLQVTGSLTPALGPSNKLTRCQQLVLQLRGQGSTRDRTTPLHSGAQYIRTV